MHYWCWGKIECLFVSLVSSFLFSSSSFVIFPQKYLNPLKSQENASLIEAQTVDEIFLMVPSILGIHQQFLDELRSRLEIWEPLQRVGDAFVQVFSTTTVLETYTLFVNNVNRAKSAIRNASNHRPAFARFLESMAREHKGKLTVRKNLFSISLTFFHQLSSIKLYSFFFSFLNLFRWRWKFNVRG